MNVNTKKLPSNKIELEIEIPAPLMNSYFDLAASELSKDMKIKGFRPGKVPADIVEKERGSQELCNQAANTAIRKTLPKTILDEELEIVGQPEISVIQISRGGPMKYKAVFQTFPDIKLGNYKGLKVKKKQMKIEDKEVENSLDYLQKSRTKFITVNRSVEEGDRIEIDFITRHDKVKIEEGEGKNHPLIIGQGRFLPGFEENLKGMKTGEEKKFSLKAPADWPQKNVANKNLDFEVKMGLVQKREIPQLTDEFAKSLGEFSSLDELKKNIKQGLIQEKEAKEKERIRMELIQKAAKNSEMDIPQALIDIELDKMINELRTNIERAELDFDKYLQGLKKSADELKKEWRDQAEKRVRIGLTLREIAKKEKIEVSEQEVENKINEILRHYPDIKQAEKNFDIQALREYTKDVIKNEKVFQLLEREAKIV